MYTKVMVLEKNTLCLSFFKNSLRFQPEIKRTGKQKKGIALLPDKQDRKMRKKFLYLSMAFQQIDKMFQFSGWRTCSSCKNTDQGLLSL